MKSEVEQSNMELKKIGLSWREKFRQMGNCLVEWNHLNVNMSYSSCMDYMQ